MARMPVLYPKKQETKKMVKERKKEETACLKKQRVRRQLIGFPNSFKDTRIILYSMHFAACRTEKLKEIAWFLTHEWRAA